MSTVETLERQSLQDKEHISLCETLDRVLNKGVVVAGEVVISVANIDLDLPRPATAADRAARERAKQVPACVAGLPVVDGTLAGVLSEEER